MRLLPYYLSFDGCWVWNYCVQGSWAAARSTQVLSDDSFALPDPVTFNCDPAACCCDGTHDGAAIAPAATGAPWFDRHSPASAQFFGLLGETVTLSPVAAVDGGGWEVVVVAQAIASTTSGLQRGLTWLEHLTRGCTSVTWYEHCRPIQFTGAPEDAPIPDDGWRTACGARRIGEMQATADESPLGLCSAKIVMTFRGDGCITGTSRQGPERLLAIGEPVARELCIPGVAARQRGPAWLERPPEYSTLAMGRWTDPWQLYSPPASFVSPVVAGRETIAWDVIVKTPTDPLFNLRLEIIELDPSVQAIAPTLQSFRQYRRHWTALLPELPPETEISIGADCAGASALMDGRVVSASAWLRSGSAGPYAHPPVVGAGSCAARFALVAWASAERGPGGCCITPADATVMARVRNVYRPAA